jgi:hypothetical protein
MLEKNHSIDTMVKDLATVNLFLIFIIIIVGFGVIKIVKKRFED